MSRRSKKRTAREEAAATQRGEFVTLESRNRSAGLTDRGKVLGVCLFLAAVAWAVFGQTLRHQFINFDDGDYVFKNPKVFRGLTIEGIVWAFTNVHAANWHPLTWLSHMLDSHLWGLNPGGHHLTNVLLHMATAVLLFLVLRQMSARFWRSAFVAAVFAIHPLRVESVAWVAERKDVLSGLFFVLTISAYVRYARRPWSAARYGLVVLLFAFGLMSKPMLVTLPFVLFLLDYWPLNRARTVSAEADEKPPTPRRLILEKVPLLAMSIASCVVTLLAQKAAIRPSADYPIGIRVSNALISSVAYIRQMLWPSDLAAFYPFAAKDVVLARVLVPLVLLAGITVAVFVLRRHRYLVTGWLWYLVMLGPVIGILQVGSQGRADRYTYLPQIGLYVLITWAVAELSRRWRHRHLILGTLAVITLTALTLSARAYASYWKDSESLWTHALTHTSDNAMAELNLGEAIYKLGRTAEAIGHFKRALQIEPNEATIHGSLGSALMKIGQTKAALTHFQQSLEINPKQASVHSSLGVALLETGRAEESLAHLQTAVKIDPADADAHYNLGNTFLHLGRANEAVAEYTRALNINPDDTQALNNMAWILSTWPDALTRDGARAVALAERADSLTRGASPVISATLAAAYAEAGRPADAVKAAQRALQLSLAEGDNARATSIREQLELYQAGSAFRDRRSRL